MGSENRRGYQWFKFYYGDWLTDEDTLKMTASEKGIYIDLLALQGQHGSLPADHKAIARLLPCSSRAVLRWMQKWDKLFPLCNQTSSNGNHLDTDGNHLTSNGYHTSSTGNHRVNVKLAHLLEESGAYEKSALHRVEDSKVDPDETQTKSDEIHACMDTGMGLESSPVGQDVSVGQGPSLGSAPASAPAPLSKAFDIDLDEED